MKIRIFLMPKFKILSGLAFSLCCVGLLQWNALQSLNQRPKTLSLVGLHQLNLAKVAKLKTISSIPTFGFRNILADGTFLDFLQYFGDDTVRERDGYALSTDFFEAILSLDPHYRNFYLFLSGSGSVYAAKPIESVEMMDEALEGLAPNKPSDSYFIWRYKGIDELLFVVDGQAAQKSFEMAADWAEESQHSESERFQELSRQTAIYLASNPQSKAAQVNAWSSVLTTALDDETRQRAVEQIETLGGSVTFSEDGGINIEFAQKTNSKNSGG